MARIKDLENHIEELKGIIDEKDAQISRVEAMESNMQTHQDNVNKAVSDANDVITNATNAINDANAAAKTFESQQQEYETLMESIELFWNGDDSTAGIKDDINNFWKGDEDEDGMKEVMNVAVNSFLDDWEGKKDTEGNRSGGQKDEVIKEIQKLDDYWKGEEDEEGNRAGGMEEYIKDKKVEIEGLLYGATNVALGKGYEDQANIHDERARGLAKLFYWGIGAGVLILGVFVLSISVDWIDNDWLISGMGYLIVTPISFGLGGLIIWLCTFLKDKEKEERMLKSEYEHKRQVVNVVVGYKKHMENEHGDDTESADKAIKKLYDELIEATGHNPSLRINQKGGEHFFQLLIEKLSSKPKIDDAIEEGAKG